tara:strand:+ start:204 stop:833 length:630 start_codon:yes stop_codon:yes gene_type:complete
MTGIVSQNVARTSGLIKAASGGGGTWTLIKTLTSDGSDATMSFVDGTSDVVLDSTYPIYVFKLIGIHPETDGERLAFQGNVAGGSGYNETMTTTSFRAYHDEADSDTALGYEAGNDQAQGTGYQDLSDNIGNGNDESASGELRLFNPSSTTFVTHFIANFNTYQNSNYSMHTFVGGYFNLTGAIDEIQFKMTSGEIQGGKIKLYGLSDS